jgi:hypothetical protein
MSSLFIAMLFLNDVGLDMAYNMARHSYKYGSLHTGIEGELEAVAKNSNQWKGQMSRPPVRNVLSFAQRFRLETLDEPRDLKTIPSYGSIPMASQGKDIMTLPA